MPFKTTKGREKDNLVEKGGDKRISLGGKSSVFYDTQKKVDNMERLEKGVPQMARTTQRINF